jgi:hypothetical protein
VIDAEEVERIVAIQRRVVAQPAICRVRIIVKLVREGIQLHAAFCAERRVTVNVS